PAGPRAGAPAGERQPGDRADDAAPRRLLPHGPLGARRRPCDEPGGGVAMIDWVALGDETVDLLRRYLMIDTTNPPGNEIAGVRFLAEVLSRDGIESETIEAAPAGPAFARGSPATARSAESSCTITSTWSTPTGATGPSIPSAARSPERADSSSCSWGGRNPDTNEYRVQSAH